MISISTQSKAKRQVSKFGKLSNCAFMMKVECKKAQPKEAVITANTAALIGKRVILSNLGVLPSLGLSGAALNTSAAQQQQLFSVPFLQAALQKHINAAAPMGKIEQIQNCMYNNEYDFKEGLGKCCPLASPLWLTSATPRTPFQACPAALAIQSALPA